MAFECSIEPVDKILTPGHVCITENCFPSASTDIYVVTDQFDIRFLTFLLYDNVRIVGMHDMRKYVNLVDIALPYGIESCSNYTCVEALACPDRPQDAETYRYVFEYKYYMSRRDYIVFKSFAKGGLTMGECLSEYPCHRPIIHVSYNITRLGLNYTSQRFNKYSSTFHRHYFVPELFLKLSCFNAYESGLFLCLDQDNNVSLRFKVR